VTAEARFNTILLAALGVVGLVLAAVGGLASLIPARRATRVSPTRAL
jgi:hypothetical protein